MWLLEHEGDALQGKRLWLRPGKRYLFGRTIAERGMLAIHGDKSSSVSRKHVTIEVDQVRPGDSQNLSKRSKITVEDLKSKLGTVVNGEKIKGEKYAIDQEENELKMGNMSGFKITWFSVVLSFQFSKRELDAGAQTRLQDNFEQLDVKLLAEVDSEHTTHVVNKKRNTPKGLQALVNGAYLVDDGFTDTLFTVTRADDGADGVGRSALEDDFDAHWPDAMNFLPAPGNEPVQRPAEAFAPNLARREMFDGYTFIFYDDKQHDNLIGAITDGKGKALYTKVEPGKTKIDDFIRYVKSVAGEKGLGEFEDGSEGKGVVVVRYVPAEPWYQEFYTSVSLRLDHRLPDQKDFLDAILACDASKLRRPLEVETERPRQSESGAPEQAMEVDSEQVSQPKATRRPAPAPRKRFKGFISDSDSDGDSKADILMPEPVPTVPSQAADEVESSQEGLFVSQEVNSQEPEAMIETARTSQRKRPALLSLDEEFAPTAAQLKRRRLEAGEDPVPRQPSPENQPESDDEPVTTKGKKGAKGKASKVKEEFDVLEIARKNRAEAEAKAKAERDELEQNADGLDLAEIGRLQIVETMELRKDLAPTRTRAQDIADGRWNPAWNGRKNFKAFKQKGAVQPARERQRIIIELEEAKANTGGIGDDYWLEDEDTQKRKKKNRRDSQGQASGTFSTNKSSRKSQKSASTRNDNVESDVENTAMDDLDESNPADEDGDDEPVPSTARRRGTRDTSTPQESLRSQRTTQRSTATRNTAKRSAPAPPAKEQPAKRSRRENIPDSDDSDDSEDELRFRFRKR
ncbi:DNA damage response protein RcaA [Pestalotiopsis sp. NC0098]|nr:DNA damage response protein RcaA [Pestalotiopsis sp. NC0098]